MSLLHLARQVAHSVRGRVPPEAVLQTIDLSSDRQNQLLFFFKPECFLLPEDRRSAFVSFVLESLARWDIDVSGAMTLSGENLESTGAMSRHYGYINRMSRTASYSLDEGARQTIFDLVGSERGTEIFGGHEILAEFPDFTAASLEELWDSKPSVRVRSGLYVQAFDVHEFPLIIVNGFHPRQLAHFTSEDRRVVLLVLNSDLPWQVLRGRVLGDTYPENAVPGSIRREALERADEFGFSSVSVGNNCCHMSAGPFEALVEVDNFLSDSSVLSLDLERAKLVRSLRALSWNGPLSSLLDNPILSPPTGEQVSLHDLTEDVDTISAAQLFALLESRGV